MEAQKLNEAFRRILTTTELVELKDDDTIHMVEEGRGILAKELNNLIDMIKNKKNAQYIKETGVDSFLKLIKHVAELKAQQVRSVSTRNAQPEMKTGKLQDQVKAVLECLKKRPEYFQDLHRMLCNMNARSDGSLPIDAHQMEDIHCMLKLQQSTTEPDNETILSKDDLSCLLHNLEIFGGFQSNIADTRPDHEGKAEKTEESTVAKKTKTLVDVQVLDPLPSGATASFFEAFKEELEIRGIRAIMIDVQAFNADDNGSNLVMVICNNYSRLQGNLTNTIQKIIKQRLKRIMLIVLHCKKPSLLPSVSSQSELKQYAEIEDISGIVDMAFHKDESRNGIYDCEMNKCTFELIENLSKTGNLCYKVNRCENNAKSS